MKIKYSIAIASTTWCGLGFYRGTKYYKYDLEKYNLDKYNIKYNIKKNYLYSNSIIYGFFGVLLYINPVFLPIIIYKESYRLEVNLRNLQDEKNSDYYNNIIT